MLKGKNKGKKRETKGHFKKDKKTLLSTQKGSQHHQKNAPLSTRSFSGAPNLSARCAPPPCACFAVEDTVRASSFRTVPVVVVVKVFVFRRFPIVVVSIFFTRNNKSRELLD